MKKAILLSLSPFFFGAIAVQAQNATPAATAVSTTTTTTAAAPKSDRTPVKKEDLPEAVKKTLASEDYKGWEVGEAFWVKNEKDDHYEIVMKQAEKSLLVKMNKEGKKID